MSRKRKKIIITRPIDQGKEFAQLIMSKIDNIKATDIIFEPMLEIIHIDVDIGGVLKYDGVIVTSANAIHIIKKNPDLKNIPFCCVGKKTAQKLKNIGVQHIDIIAKTSAELLDIINKRRVKNFLYLRGKDIFFDLAKNSDFTVTEVVCYEAKKVDRFSNDFLKYMSDNKDGDCLIAFFSRRTAENFVRLLSILNRKNSVDLNKIHVLCISDSVLKCVDINLKKGRSFISVSPDVEGMLDAVDSYSINR